MKSLVFQGISILLFTLFLAEGALAQSRYRGYTVGDYLDESDIVSLGETGANVARVWCRPANLSATEDRTAFLARTEECLDQLDEQLPSYDENGVKVIFAMDPPAPLYASTSGTPQHNIFLSAEHQAWFKEAWTLIAARYAGDARILGFDLLNEPAARKVGRGLEKWSGLALSLISIVRSAGATQTLFVESQYGNPVKMSEVSSICKKAKKSGFTNIHGSFHFYSPFSYTHQPTPGAVAPPTAKEKKKLEKVLKAAKQGSCDGIYVGEFGSTFNAPLRVDYFQWLIGYFEAKGWNWTCHAFREGSFWNTETDFNGGTSTSQLLRSYQSLNQ